MQITNKEERIFKRLNVLNLKRAQKYQKIKRIYLFKIIHLLLLISNY